MASLNPFADELRVLGSGGDVAGWLSDRSLGDEFYLGDDSRLDPIQSHFSDFNSELLRIALEDYEAAIDSLGLDAATTAELKRDAILTGVALEIDGVVATVTKVVKQVDLGMDENGQPRTGYMSAGGASLQSNGILTLSAEQYGTFEQTGNWDHISDFFLEKIVSSGTQSVTGRENPATYQLLENGNYRLIYSGSDVQIQAAYNDAFPGKGQLSSSEIDQLRAKGGTEFSPTFDSRSECFAAGTPILMADGTEKPIEQIAVGDLVMSFTGQSDLVPARVSRTFVNVSDSLLELSSGLLTTPRHPFLTADGGFVAIADLLASGGLVVGVNGNVQEEELTAVHGAEQHASSGSLAIASHHFTVFNFQVEETQTYIAGGYRVHNTSWTDLVNTDKEVIFKISDTEIVSASTIGEQIHREITQEGGNTVTVTQTIAFDDSDSVVVQIWDANDIVDGKPTGTGEISIDHKNEFISGAQIGSVFGSALGNAIGGSVIEDIVFSATLDTVFSSLGEFAETLIEDVTVSPDGQTNNRRPVTTEEAANDAFNNFGSRLGANLIGAGISQISSFVVGEIIGGDSIAADLGRSVANSFVSAALTDFVATQVLTQGSQISTFLLQGGSDLFDIGINFNPFNAIASYFGSQLASSLVQAEGEAAALVSNLLGTIGSIIGTNILPVIGTFVGQFIGEVFGALVGNELFGDEDFPRALVTIEVGAGGEAVNVGDYVGVDGMAGTAIQPAADALVSGLNGMLERFGPDARFEGVGGTNQLFAVGYISVDGYQGLNKGYTIANANTGTSFPLNTWSQAGFDQNDFNEAYKFAVLHAVENGMVEGGDAWGRRVLYYGGWETFEQLMDQLQVAVDYRNYLENKSVIDRLITEAPDSSFAIGWLVTLAQAASLGFTNPDALQNLIEGTDLAELIDGTIYNDEIIGKAGNDTLNGADGNDLLNGGAGADILNGGAGLNTASYRDAATGVTVDLNLAGITGDPARTASAQVSAGEASGDLLTDIQRLFGSDYSDTLIGDAGDNLLAGYGGADALQGGDGDDTIEGGAGADGLDGGAGYDIATYAGSATGVKVSLQEEGGPSIVAGTGEGGDAQGDTLLGFEALSGSLHSDILIGNSADNMLLGNDGNDFLEGMGGADRLIGGSGVDFAVYTNSDAAVVVDLSDDQAESGGHAEGDILSSVEYVIGSAFADTITGDGFGNVIEGGAGADILDGGDGMDAISYAGATGGVFIDLIKQEVHGAGGDADGDVITGFESAIGTNYDDEIIVGHDNAVVLAGAGDDVITPFSGNVSIDGGEGQDTVNFGKIDNAGDFLPLFPVAGDGSVTASGGYAPSYTEGGLFTGSQWGDTEVFQGADIYEIWGQALEGLAVDVNSFAPDTDRYQIRLNSIERLTATEFDDRIAFNDYGQYVHAGGGNDEMVGAAGDDQHWGDAGNDILGGREGNDTLDGGIGDDALRGGMGNDHLIGGAGDDLLEGDADHLQASYFDVAQAGTANTGDDFLDGGAGDDSLRGGLGNDTYYFGRGYGWDRISEWVQLDTGQTGKLGLPQLELVDGGNDTILFAPDILPGDLVVSENQGTLIIAVSGTSDELWVDSFDSLNGYSAIEKFRFEATGLELNVGGLSAADAAAALAAFGGGLLTGTSSADAMVGTASNDIMSGLSGNDTIQGKAGDDAIDGGVGNDFLEGGAGNDALEGGTETDRAVYHGDLQDFVLTDSGTFWTVADVNAADGDEGTDTLTNVEEASFNGRIVKLDGSNNAPFLIGSLADQEITELAAFSYVLPSTLFHEVDNGQSVTLSAMLANGQALPAWLSFDAVSGTFTALAGDTLPAHLDVIVRATDDQGGYTEEGFNLSVLDQIVGTAEGETLSGGATGLYLQGLAGDDALVAGEYADILEGGDGIDTVDYSQSFLGVDVDLVSGTGASGDAAGDRYVAIENVIGSRQNDIIRATDGVNNIQTGRGNDIVYGGGGNDTVIVSGGANSIDGGDGYDIVSFADSLFEGYAYTVLGDGSIVWSEYANNFSVSTSAPAGDIYIVESASRLNHQTIYAVEELYASNAADHISVGGGNLTIYGMGGDDRIHIGSAAGNTISGGAGADWISTQGTNTTLSYEDSFAAVTVDLAAGTASGGDAQGDILDETSNALYFQFAHLIGSAHNDYLSGDEFSNTLVGGEGDDHLTGGAGADELKGQGGNDFARYDASGAGVNVDLSTGIGSGGDAEGDTLTDIENVHGSEYDDVLSGDSGANILIGSAGNDTLNGDAGADTLSGNAGADHLDGGVGIDTANYSSSSAAVNINLFLTTAQSGGHAQGDTLLNIENVVGSSHSDIISGDHDANVLWGAGGNDSVYGNGGADTIYGEAGNDVLIGQGGADYIDGGDGTDTLSFVGSFAGVIVDVAAGTGLGGDAEGDAYSNVENVSGSDYDDLIYAGVGTTALSGGAGADNLVSGAGAIVLDGGTGADWANYGRSSAGVTVNLGVGTASGGDAEGDTFISIEYLWGSAHNDSLTGTTGVNYLAGSGGNDYLDGNAGNDSLFGGDGHDTLRGGAGADILDGGDGIDIAHYDFSGAGVTVDLATGTGLGGQAEGDTLTGIENIYATAYVDTLTGDAGANRLYGLGGNDTIGGDDGDDILEGGMGADVMDGGAGIDTAHYGQSTAGVTVDLATGTGLGGEAEGDTLTGIENIYGSAYGDTLTGDAGDNVLSGGDSDDTLSGESGVNTLAGGAGDDMLAGGAGTDAYDGGAGVDTVDYSASASGVTVYLAAGTGSGGDAIGDTFTNVENIVGSGHADDLTGDGASNLLAGGAGDDMLEGGTGADVIDGGLGVDTASYAGSAAGVTVDLAAGTGTGGDAEGDTLTSIENLAGSSHNDFLYGDGSANVLDGSAGSDHLIGGLGADTLIGGSGEDYARYDASASAVTVDLAAGTGLGGTAEGDALVGIEHVHGSEYDDVLSGDAGANILIGSGGNDTLNGGAGADTLSGNAGADYLDGGIGDDIADYSASAAGITVDLAAGTGLGGDAEGDTLANIENVVGSAYDDSLTGDAGANVLSAGDGNDTLEGGLGGDSIDGGNGVDTLSFAGSATGVTVDLMSGTGAGGDAEGDTYAGIENIVGSAFDDVLTGDAGDNSISGGAGDDLFIGTAGADSFSGGAGSDAVSYENSTAGVTVDLSTGAGAGGYAEGDFMISVNEVTGSAFNDVLIGKSGTGALFGGAGDDTLDGRDGANTLDGGEGSDTYLVGTEGGYDTIADTGLVGTDRIVATADNAVIGVHLALSGIEEISSGGFANVTIQGLWGADLLDFSNVILTGITTIDGGNGSNTIIGTANSETILAGSGHDTLSGGAGDDTISGGSGVNSLDGGDGVDTALFSGNYADYAVAITNNGGTVTGLSTTSTLSNFEILAFADRTINLTGGNNAPILVSPIDPVSHLIDTPISIDLGVHFADIDAGDTLSFSATLADGSALPSWMSIDPVTGALSGTPGALDTAALSVTVRATDGSGAFTETGLDLEVIRPNVAPVLANAIAGQTALEDGLFSFAVPAGTFADPDPADAILALSATLADGSPLPGWLTFDPVTNTFSGTPSNDDVGVVSVKLTATDEYAETAETLFSLTVENVNDAPTASSVTGSVDEGQTYAVDLEALAADIDGDVLSFSLTSTPLTGTTSLVGSLLTYQAAIGAFDPALIAYQVDDGNGASAAGTVDLTVNDINFAPTATAATASVDEGQSVSIDLAAYVTDPDGDALTYSLDGSPAIGSASLTGSVITYDSIVGGFGTQLVGFAVSDGNGGVLNGDVDVTVNNINFAPVASAAGQTIDEGQSFTIDLATLTSDVDGDALTYSVTTAPTAGTATVTGSSLTYTSVDGAPGTYSIGYTVSDGQGGTATEIISANVVDVNYAPTAVDDVKVSLLGYLGTANNIAIADLLANDSDPDGDVLSIVGFSNFVNVSDVALNLVDGLVTWVHDLSVTHTYSFSYTVSDGNGHTSSATLSGDWTPYSVSKPIVFDLDSDGIELVNADESDIFFDLNGDGVAEHTGWVAPDDGLLVYDKDGDGAATAHDEVSFTGYKEGARTDLEGLQAFDTNGDGVLDASDAEFGAFNVWQDANGNGISEAGEMVSLAEAGIQSLRLSSDEVVRTVGNNVSFGVGSYTRSDGTDGAFSDTGFGAAGLTLDPEGLGTLDESGAFAGSDGEIHVLNASLEEVLSGQFAGSLVTTAQTGGTAGEETAQAANVISLISAMAAFNPESGGESNLPHQPDDEVNGYLAASIG